MIESLKEQIECLANATANAATDINAQIRDKFVRIDAVVMISGNAQTIVQNGLTLAVLLERYQMAVKQEERWMEQRRKQAAPDDKIE